MRSANRSSLRIAFATVTVTAMAVAFLLAFASAMVSAPPFTLRVASLNVHRCVAGVERVAAVLRERDAAIVCLQETSEADAHEIARRLGISHVRFATRVARPIDGGAPWGCAILSRRPLANGVTIPRFAGKGMMGLWARVDTVGGPIRVANVHLAATYGYDPRHVVESNGWRSIELADLIEAHRADGLPMLAIGDFNQPPTGVNYDAMRRLGTDALAELGHDGPTFRSGWIATRIDYAIVTPGLTAIDGGLGSDDASDHRLVWVDVRIDRR